MAAPLNIHASAGSLQPGFAFNAGVARVGTDVPAGVTQITQRFKQSGIGHTSICNGDLADSLQLSAALIDAGATSTKNDSCHAI
jgi:hypothetical protein